MYVEGGRVVREWVYVQPTAILTIWWFSSAYPYDMDAGGAGVQGDITFPLVNGNPPLRSHTSQMGNRQGLTTARPSHHPNFPASPSHSCPPSLSLLALPGPLFLSPCTLSTTPDAGTKQLSCLPSYRPRPRERNPQKQDTPLEWFPSRRPWRGCRHLLFRELPGRYLAPVCPYPGGYAGHRRGRGSWGGSRRICGRGVPIWAWSWRRVRMWPERDGRAT